MKSDITSAKDIELLINNFYDKVKNDALLAPFFKNINWEKHLPIMYKFMENLVFYTGGYIGNPMQKHKSMSTKNPFKPKDFKQWLKLFTKTVNENFKGEKSELIKQRVHSIATVMQIKINA